MYDKVCTKAQWYLRQNALKQHIITGFSIQTDVIQNLYEEFQKLTKQMTILNDVIQQMKQDIHDIKQMNILNYQQNLK